MTLTDFITLCISVFLLIRGFMRGFLNSLLGPFSIIAASIISIIYYQQTKQLMASLIIGLAGPLVLHLLLRYFVHLIIQVDKPGFVSRMAGAFMTLLWGWVFIFFTLILLMILPPVNKRIADMQHDVGGSLSYSFVDPIKDKFFPQIPTSKENAVNGPTPAAQTESLAQDPRFQEVMQDPEVQSEIKAHDIAKLMSNKKVLELTQQLMADPTTLKKVLSLYSQSQQTQISGK